jgi:hypothetical protein
MGSVSAWAASWRPPSILDRLSVVMGLKRHALSGLSINRRQGTV